jgi:hypothetical protein
MRACKHYSYDIGDETDIIQSEGHSWNAWLLIFWRDQKIESSFEAGLMLEYLRHLSEHPECCKEIGWKLEDVKERLREVEEEWKEAVGLNDP